MISIRKARESIHYGVLCLLGIIFALPFVWLVLTSVKEYAEIFTYPIRWLPLLPHQTSKSPLMVPPKHVTPYIYRVFRRPKNMDPTRWREMEEKLRRRIWEHALPLVSEEGNERLAITDAKSRENFKESLPNVIWVDILQKVPEDIWELDFGGIVSRVLAVIDADVVNRAWDKIHQSFALGDIIFTDHSGGPMEYEALDKRWVYPPDQKIIWYLDELDIEKKRLDEFAYELSRDRTVVLTRRVRLASPTSALRTVEIPYKSDQTYNRLKMGLHAADGVYKPESEDISLGTVINWPALAAVRYSFVPRSDRYQDLVELEKVPRAKTTVTDPYELKITYELHQPSFLAAAFGKFWGPYHRAFRFVPYGRYTFNSFLLVILNVTLQILSCSMIAYAFARLRWFGRDTLFLIVLATMMLPGQVTMIPHFVIIKYLGWYDTLKPLWVGAMFGSAFFIFLLRQFMMGIPIELEDVAKIDGCGYFGIYRMIILPLIKPALITVGIFSALGTWNNFMGPLIFISSEEKTPLALGLYLYQLIRGGDFGEMMAASLVMVLPVIIVFFMAQKYFIRGVTLTGLKG